MAVVRCPHGHYYDGLKFSSCPHCGISIKADVSDYTEKSIEQEVKSRGGLFRWLDRDKTVALKQTVSNEESHTIELEQMMNSSEDENVKTIGFFSSAKGNDFVTGWLVCISGAEKGRDYRLHHGFNRIGRDFGMDVQIADDQMITRKNHCSIVYDDRENKFSLIPSTGTLTYFNNSLLTKTQMLQMGDLVTMGNSTFEFIPFCREGRIWEKEEEN